MHEKAAGGRWTAFAASLALVACARPEPASAPIAQRAAQTPTDRAGSAPDAVPPIPVRTAPVPNQAAESAHAAAQTRLGEYPLQPNALVGFVPLSRGEGKPPPMAHFHTALRALTGGTDPDGKVRVAFYGASSVAADRYTGYLRHYLQSRFGDGGPGFVALAPLWKWHRHDAVNAKASKHWRIEHGQRKTGKLDGLYGVLGASAHADHKRARTEIHGKKDATDVSEVEVWYLAQPGGGSAVLEVMGKRFELSTAASAPGPGYFRAEGITAGPVAIDVRPQGDGEVRLLGAVLERSETGVVVDALGIGGTRSANMLVWDEPLWRDNLQRRPPDLWALAYGANEAVDEDEAIEVYRDNLQQVVARFAAAAPEASCLLLGPVDFPLMVEGATKKDVTWTERPRCTAIIEVQREVAAAQGCGFFDAKAMMGGDGSMDRWATADPPLGKSDHLHFTPLGYVHLGRVLADATMADFDDPPVR